MTAVQHVSEGDLPPPRHPLAPGAAADTIREHLLEEDRPTFDVELREAAASNDLRMAEDCLEHWRCIAVIQSDRALFIRTARRAAARNTGQASPPDEPLPVTRRKAGM